MVRGDPAHTPSPQTQRQYALACRDTVRRSGCPSRYDTHQWIVNGINFFGFSMLWRCPGYSCPQATFAVVIGPEPCPTGSVAAWEASVARCGPVPSSPFRLSSYCPTTRAGCAGLASVRRFRRVRCCMANGRASDSHSYRVKAKALTRGGHGPPYPAAGHVPAIGGCCFRTDCGDSTNPLVFALAPTDSCTSFLCEDRLLYPLPGSNRSRPARFIRFATSSRATSRQTGSGCETYREGNGSAATVIGVRGKR